MANLQARKWSLDGLISGPSLTPLPPLQYGMPTQRAEVLLQVPYSEANEEAAFPLQEEAEDGGPGEWISLGSSMGDTSPCLSLCLMSLPLSLPLTDLPESHVASNDSDSELEEAPELLSPAEEGALHHLSFLEKQGSEASVEEAEDSGSEEQLGRSAGEDGDWEGLSQYNTNQCNNVAVSLLPAMEHGDRHVIAGTGLESRPEFV